MQQKLAIVIGAGIVGLASARALAQKGFSVKVFDRNPKAIGASVRNFGMVWPIGQPAGILYKRAMRTMNIWKEIATEANIWYEHTGSLHLAYSQEEWEVLKELEAIFKIENRNVILLDKNEVEKKYTLINSENLYGGLFSEDEIIIDPREAIAELPYYLSTKFNIEFHWNKCVSNIADKTIYVGKNENHSADVIFVCSGTDFETLYPEIFASLPITKCKLQMMRTNPLANGERLKSAICGGLSLLHYTSFKVAPSLHTLAKKMNDELKEYIDLGIHVMISQNSLGEITIGDSHEYGLCPDPFDKVTTNQLILQYLKQFLKFDENNIKETWQGIYPKLTNGATEIFLSPEQGVYILNGVGGAGMTLSFGLAEEVVNQITV